MNMLHWMNVMHRVRDGIKYRIATTVILMCGAISIVCAAGFAIAAGYMWLATELPAYQAALCLAGGLLLGGGIAILVACRRNRRTSWRGTGAPAPDITGQAEATADRAVQAALSEVQKSPTPAILTALALGVVVGLLRPKDDP